MKEIMLLKETQVKRYYVEALVFAGVDISFLFPKSKITRIEKMVFNGTDISKELKAVNFPTIETMLTRINNDHCSNDMYIFQSN